MCAFEAFSKAHFFRKRAEDRARTGHPQLGRLMLYQMSYFRGCLWFLKNVSTFQKATKLIIISIKRLFNLIRFKRPLNNFLTYSTTHVVGREGFEPSKLAQRIYSPSHLATLESPLHSYLKNRADGGIRTPDQLITNQLLWPTELHRQNFYKTTAIFVYCPKL